MSPQPDPLSPQISWPSLPQVGTPSFATPESLIWALRKYFGADEAAGSDAPDASSGPPADAKDPSTYQISLPSLPSLAGGGDPGLGGWNPRADWASSQTDPAGAPAVRYHTAQPGESISAIMGSSDPWAIGEFMQLNGLDSSQIRAGQAYRLPDLTTPRLDGAFALGFAAQKADNARRAASARSASASSHPSQGIWVDGNYYPPDQTGAAAAALEQPSPKAGASPHISALLVPTDHIRPLSPWEGWTTNISNRRAQARQTFDSAQDFFDQRSVLNSPIRNAALTAEGVGREVQGVQQGLFAVPAGILDTATSLARGEGPWASPSVQQDTDSAVGVGSLAAAVFNPELAEAGSAELAGTYAGPDNLASEEARGGAYVLRDRNTGEVMRSGRTNDLRRRKAEHARHPVLRQYTFDPVFRTDNYDEQRGLEQYLHDTYTPPLNRIRPISPGNDKILIYNNAARSYLDRIGLP